VSLDVEWQCTLCNRFAMWKVECKVTDGWMERWFTAVITANDTDEESPADWTLEEQGSPWLGAERLPHGRARTVRQARIDAAKALDSICGRFA
jgi:hypothetical protein